MISIIVYTLFSSLKSRYDIVVENLALCRQLDVLTRNAITTLICQQIDKSQSNGHAIMPRLGLVFDFIGNGASSGLQTWNTSTFPVEII